jgi:16S rRNA (uracil1498-N3)-methyltransferase
MPHPFFFSEEISLSESYISLNEETSKHIVHVLRMKIGEELLLTDGRGNLLTCKISDAHKKKCVVNVQESRHKVQVAKKISIAISLLKNANRFEWFLEKATELGIAEIIPAICMRTEKQHFRYDRMKNILISAMLQSQQVWLPSLNEPLPIKEIILHAHQSQKFIAHCMNGAKVSLSDAIDTSTYSQIVLIGPEGDFTKEEIDIAFKNHFVSVALGDTRLRTETAGIIAATLLAMQ